MKSRLFNVLLASSVAVTCCAPYKAPKKPLKEDIQRPAPKMPEPKKAEKKPEKPVLELVVKQEPEEVKEPERSPLPETYQQALELLRESGYPNAAQVLEWRVTVTNTKKKMKLTEDEAVKVATYLILDLPQMPNTVKLLEELPKASVEIVRGVNERDVAMDDAEAIADYLLRFLESMKLTHPHKFDENLSHVICREWHQIDYSDEGTSWRRVKPGFVRMGVEDFRTKESVEIYFTWESKQGFFKRIYKPRGRLPD